jgi:hypothetical protein
MLQKESGCSLETETVHTFRQCIESGQWDEAEAFLPGLLSVSEKEDLPKIQFMVKEQKFLEALERGQTAEALKILRRELTPLTLLTSGGKRTTESERRLHQLAG